MSKLSVTTIISGGQTGADRGALDAAIALGLTHGGWCPRGRIAEDGRIPERYVMHESLMEGYAHRTELNISAADATLLVTSGNTGPGSALTIRIGRKHGRPFKHINLADHPIEDAAYLVHGWLYDLVMCKVLNVAGTRLSACPTIHADVYELIYRTFQI